MVEYTKGIRIKTIQGKYGEFMSVGINVDEFKNNLINERGYINFKITKSKKGDWYAVNDAKPNEVELVTNQNCNESYVNDDEIPF